MKSLKSKQLPVTLRKTNTYQADTDEPAVSIHVQRHKQLQCIQIRGPGSDLMHLLENKHLPFTPPNPQRFQHTHKKAFAMHTESNKLKYYIHTPQKTSHHAHTQEQAVSLKKEYIATIIHKSPRGIFRLFPCTIVWTNQLTR